MFLLMDQHLKRHCVSCGPPSLLLKAVFGFSSAVRRTSTWRRDTCAARWCCRCEEVTNSSRNPRLRLVCIAFGVRITEGLRSFATLRMSDLCSLCLTPRRVVDVCGLTGVL